jgi:hypothetical protein
MRASARGAAAKANALIARPIKRNFFQFIMNAPLRLMIT